MSRHRVLLVALATMFTAGVTSAALACCDWGGPAPIGYQWGSGCGGCGAAFAPVTYAAPLKYVYPQRFTAQMPIAGPPPLLRARVSRAARGRLRLLVDGRELWSRRVSLLPERRIAIPSDRLPVANIQSIHVDLIED